MSMLSLHNFFANFIDDQSNTNLSSPKKLNPMRTNLLTEPNKTVFLQTVAIALGNLKRQLQHDYEQAYPNLREVIQLVLEEEESNAWQLTLFPHLLLPDLVEEHITKLNLRPAETKHNHLLAPHHFNQGQIRQLAFA
jgi:hypothetical protein